MIALPGLTLPTGKYEVARSILRPSAKHVDQGMLPNRFPDAGETPEYNTVDAALWFLEAARAYLAYTGDLEFVRDELYLVFADITSWHTRGTRYGIKVDPSGLLASGELGVQLTWMDAKVGDWVVTPRRGNLSKFRLSGTTRCALWKTRRSGSGMRLRENAIATWPQWRIGVSTGSFGTKSSVACTTW
jgi:predicted glycogen debranching enzyme